MKNQPGVAQLLIDTLNDPTFYQLLYPQDTQETTIRRLEHMIDLYLNMPDKGVSENVASKHTLFETSFLLK